MAYRRPDVAPVSSLAEEERGRQVGIFCHGCGSVYALHRAIHRGKPVYGKDHVSSPCSHEGEAFDPTESWWEPAVEVIHVPPAEPEEPAA